MQRVLAAIATVIALLLAAPAAPVGAIAPDRGHSDSPPSQDRVRLTIKVQGCDTCRLGLTQLREDDTDMWSTRAKKVRRGQVFFHVPTERTHGVRISISAPWTTDYVHGVRYVVVRYRGFETGEHVSPRQASRAEPASACWNGTNRARATLRVRVARTDSEDVSGERAVGMRAYSTRTLAATDVASDRRGTVVTTYPVCPGR